MSTLISQARNRVPRFAEAAVERARLSVVPARAVRAKQGPFAVLVILLLAVGVFGLLLFNTNMQQSSFYVTSLQSRADALIAKEQSLNLELQQLRDPQRLAVVGRRLGMVAPQAPAFIDLRTGRILGTPMPATPLDAMRISSFPVQKPAELRPKPLVVHVRAKPKANTATTSTTPGSTGGRKGSTTKSHAKTNKQGATH
ncbi:MAG: hypothetical protein M3130_06150 [Actinomycetota bacterium]|nr:hypothetical protein [Actinomycetota bacterium]